nr:Ycf36 [Porphyrostromium boryanum]
MVLSRKSCPVPFEQQPLEEYNSLILSSFFSLPAKKSKFYFSFIFLFSILSTLVVNLICFPGNFLFDLEPITCLIICIISDIIALLVVSRLYFSWSYVSKRLLSATVFYEESGWYDGQIWVKTTDMLIQDRLIAMNISIPLINRIKVSVLLFLTKLLIESIFLYFY